VNLKKIEGRIKIIKTKILNIGEMRPGSIAQQYNVCGTIGCKCKDPIKPKKHGPYYQLSYAHKKKHTTRFIRPNQLSEVKKQTMEYKKLKALIDLWIDLALEHADQKLKDSRDKNV
jgi:hypothetical protein